MIINDCQYCVRYIPKETHFMQLQTSFPKTLWWFTKQRPALAGHPIMAPSDAEIGQAWADQARNYFEQARLWASLVSLTMPILL